ncbi:MAG: 1-deoxy-D-xylulose-5-phosphate synthase [Synergistaceae bacterium]|jgi:1-deoxy-D-xylulose-5-phosphate synthase|nr:1-deoxy-D-xylulose-5-phosphate synthase [Synergistaceae bacterium]
MSIPKGSSVLDALGSYRRLALLSPGEMTRLCGEIRELITDVTLKNGGHLGGSLGAVELCAALLRTFNPERDKIIFDVGHQAYAYKILTDRLDRFCTLRRKGGISGFPRRSESQFDVFDTGHSSTSISAALGFAKARDLKGLGHEVVAVIGDGALLNGLAFEALNNVFECDTKITIVLNDNKMSISPRVGGLAEHLAKLSVSAPYRRLKRFIKDQCRAMQDGNRMENRLARVKTKLKSLLLPANIFLDMGVSYWGPFDGHNAGELAEIFELSKQYPKPLLIHAVTKKGKGCAEAESLPSLFHGVGSGTVLNGEPRTPPDAGPADWSGAVSGVLMEMAAGDERIVALTAAMEEGTKLSAFKREYPSRYFDVGIAEGHMLTFAAGLAAGGMRPVVCVYSTFLQRAMDQVVHDICMQGFPVLLAVDRAGLNGEDGETHQGLLDMAWGRSIPGLVIAAPRDTADLAFMMRSWQEKDVPVMIRYPKGRAPESLSRRTGAPRPWGRAEVLRRGSGVCIVGIGATVKMALEAADLCKKRGSGKPTVVDLRFVSPIDWGTMDDIMGSHSLVIVAEDGYREGGASEAIAARASAGRSCSVRGIGVAPGYVPHAARAEQLADSGITAEDIAAAAEDFYGGTGSGKAG